MIGDYTMNGKIMPYKPLKIVSLKKIKNCTPKKEE